MGRFLHKTPGRLAPALAAALACAAPASAGLYGDVASKVGGAIALSTAPGLRRYLAQASANAARWALDGSYPARDGNQVDLYVDGDESWSAIVKGISQATDHVYATFAYLDLAFHPVPGDARTILDHLTEAARRGADVKVVIWDPARPTPDTVPDPKELPMPGLNPGADKPGVQARWDRAGGKGLWPAATGCNHQKTFAMDGPGGGEVCFVGGLNSVQSYWSDQRHDMADPRRLADLKPGAAPVPPAERLARTPPLHDVFARVAGPSALDVACNFSERYNDATFRHADAAKDAPSCAELLLKAGDVPALPAGRAVRAQITRTIAPGKYVTLPDGETSIKEAYIRAILSARKSIYFEDQYYFDHDVIVAMQLAANRGVKVIGLLTAHPDEHQITSVAEVGMEEVAKLEVQKLTALVGRRNIALYSPATAAPDPAEPGKWVFQEIYVHAKDMVVDDSFLTLGSANISLQSMEYHSEMNVVLNDPAKAREFRKRLWMEHLRMPDIPDEVLDDPEKGFALWREHARENEEAFREKAEPVSRVFPFHLLRGVPASEEAR